MIFQNMTEFNVCQSGEVVKVSDTVSDIKEGKNAVVWSIGVIKGSSELGLTENEIEQMTKADYQLLTNKMREKFNRAGADFVIESIVELPRMIEKIEEILLLD